MTAAATLDLIEGFGIVPVVTIHDAAVAGPVAGALEAGGLACAEITLRTDAGLDAIAAVAEAHPDVLVGAGTVTTVAQADDALSAGARCVVAPGLDESIVEWGIGHDVLVLPGVMTPTEMMRALRVGAMVVKLFPAELAGGVSFLDSVRDVFAALRFVPTGGIDADRLVAYLQRPNVVACGGSWMVPSADVESAAVDRIESRARHAVDTARAARSRP
jgi:2-dehydro-3-deoxyphosphogluconate aldolase/(4S)-4-hydroxy-2-oxoglutarate aldolase